MQPYALRSAYKQRYIRSALPSFPYTRPFTQNNADVERRLRPPTFARTVSIQ
jgi:hypothetical protein